jgi:hypothetical protein
MCECKGEHRDNGRNTFCYRTDFSDDTKFRHLIALTSASEFSCKPFLCIIEDRKYENKSAQYFRDISTDTYVLADKLSMEDDTFLLAHHDYVWDDETTEDIGRVLKTMRYRADELWVPVTNLPISNCDFEGLLPRKPEPQPTPKVDLGGRAPRKQLKARIPRRDPTPSEGTPHP